MKRKKKNYLYSILGFEQTFWKIPWGTVQSMFCHAALRRVYFQECSFKYGLRTWTVFTCARLWIWNQKAGLSKLVCKCGYLISGPKLLSLHQAVMHNMDLPGHISLAVGLYILLHDVFQLLEKNKKSWFAGWLLNEEPTPAGRRTTSFSV